MIESDPTSKPKVILRVEDLSVSFPIRGSRGQKRSVSAVDHVTLELRKGMTLGLVGESGCGKSTLVRTVLGLIKPTQGTVALDGQQLTALSPGSLRPHRRKMQVVFQDPYTALDPKMTVHDLVAEPLRINRCYSPERVHELLDQVGLSSSMQDRRAADFSGGQRQRIGIARALALKPELLILDEPVSALDVSIQAQVINLLRQLQDELGLAYLFIAHDLSVVRHMSHEVAVMYLGRIVEHGTKQEIFSNPRHHYTRSLLSAIPISRPAQRHTRPETALLQGDPPDAANPPSGCRFRTRCAHAQPECALESPALVGDPDPKTHSTACFFPFRANESGLLASAGAATGGAHSDGVR